MTTSQNVLTSQTGPHFDSTMSNTHTHTVMEELLKHLPELTSWVSLSFHEEYTKKGSLQHEKVNNCHSRAKMPGAIKLFSKGFGSILSSVCERKEPDNKRTEHKSFPRTSDALRGQTWACVALPDQILYCTGWAHPSTSKGRFSIGESRCQRLSWLSVWDEPRMRKARFALNGAGKKTQFKDICLEFANIWMFWHILLNISLIKPVVKSHWHLFKATDLWKTTFFPTEGWNYHLKGDRSSICSSLLMDWGPGPPGRWEDVTLQ